MFFSKLKKLRVVPLMVAVAVSAMVACSDDDDDGMGPGDGADGTFTASVSGELSGSLDGSAAFGGATDPQTSESAWILVFTTESSDLVQVVHLGDAQPTTGTFTLSDLTGSGTFDAGDTGAVLTLSDGGVIAFSGVSVSGTVQITSASASAVSGSFDIQASGVVNPGDPGASEGTVTVSGQFDALQTSSVGFPDF